MKKIEIVKIKNKKSQDITLPAGSHILDAHLHSFVNSDNVGELTPAITVEMFVNEKEMGVREIMVFKTGEHFGHHELEYIGKVEFKGELLHIYENTRG